MCGRGVQGSSSFGVLRSQSANRETGAHVCLHDYQSKIIRIIIIYMLPLAIRTTYVAEEHCRFW